MCISVLGAVVDSLSLRSSLLILMEEFYKISLHPESCSLFGEGRGCSVNGGVGVDQKIIANPSGELTCPSTGLKQDLTHFSHSFMK